MYTKPSVKNSGYFGIRRFDLSLPVPIADKNTEITEIYVLIFIDFIKYMTVCSTRAGHTLSLHRLSTYK